MVRLGLHLRFPGWAYQSGLPWQTDADEFAQHILRLCSRLCLFWSAYHVFCCVRLAGCK